MKRGAMSRSESDEYDLRQAWSSYQEGVKNLAYAHSPEVQDMPHIQRDEAYKHALGNIAHSARALIDVLKRGGYPVQILVTDSEDAEPDK